jgi:hypothetical protein
MAFHFRAGAPLTQRAVFYLVATAAKQAGLRNLHPHTLRHSCGCYLAYRGTDLRTMQDYLGHRDPRHTVRYTRVAGRASRVVEVTQQRRSSRVVRAWIGLTCDLRTYRLDRRWWRRSTRILIFRFRQVSRRHNRVAWCARTHAVDASRSAPAPTIGLSRAPIDLSSDAPHLCPDRQR